MIFEFYRYFDTRMHNKKFNYFLLTSNAFILQRKIIFKKKKKVSEKNIIIEKSLRERFTIKVGTFITQGTRGEEIKRYLVTRWTFPQKYRRHVQMGVC